MAQVGVLGIGLRGVIGTSEFACGLDQFERTDRRRERRFNRCSDVGQ